MADAAVPWRPRRAASDRSGGRRPVLYSWECSTAANLLTPTLPEGFRPILPWEDGQEDPPGAEGETATRGEQWGPGGAGGPLGRGGGPGDYT